MYIELVFLAYAIDRVFGEFSFISFYKHPIVFMGDFIKWFEKNFYKDSVLRGGLLTISLVGVVTFISYIVSLVDNIYFQAIVASSGLASKLLYDSVKDIITNPTNIKYLVSRDTTALPSSDINKAAIETYSENLSDGVIAPMFFLLLFGLVGLFVYKAINTLDSMVGYRTKRYEKFGKISAKCDDILNYIPSRITALLIAILFLKFNIIKKIFRYGKLHKSPNAGYPISTIALVLDLKLGGDTSYFGKIEKKPYFGDGRDTITTDDIVRALKFRDYFDIFILIIFLQYIM